MESKLLRDASANQGGFRKRIAPTAGDPALSANGVFKMNGLRMYVRPLAPEPPELVTVFYSRRGEGPYYLWRYEEKLGQWRGSRVASGDFAPRELLMASWKKVPSALQTKLGEHYLD